MAINFHIKAREMKEVLNKHRIERFYHFTSVENLLIIAECNGLWSKQRLEEMELLDKIVTGGNQTSLDLDRERGNWDKVHLYFCPKTPMSYRVQENSENRNPQSSHLCYLVIDPEVALWNGVFFTDTNATANEHQRKQALEGLNLVDFSVIKSTLLSGPKPWDRVWHRKVQAECLVPDEIPLKYIKAISFISEASLREGERIWGNAKHPSFNVNEELFYTGFPFVYNFFLTSSEVTKHNVNSIQFEDEREFSQKRDSSVTLLVTLYATAGIQARVLWLDNYGIPLSTDVVEFERESRYKHWTGLEIAGLEEGRYCTEYYLREIRWFKAEFKIRR